MLKGPIMDNETVTFNLPIPQFVPPIVKEIVCHALVQMIYDYKENGIDLDDERGYESGVSFTIAEWADEYSLTEEEYESLYLSAENVLNAIRASSYEEMKMNLESLLGFTDASFTPGDAIVQFKIVE